METSKTARITDGSLSIVRSLKSLKNYYRNDKKQPTKSASSWGFDQQSKIDRIGLKFFISISLDVMSTKLNDSFRVKHILS